MVFNQVAIENIVHRIIIDQPDIFNVHSLLVWKWQAIETPKLSQNEVLALLTELNNQLMSLYLSEFKPIARHKKNLHGNTS